MRNIFIDNIRTSYYITNDGRCYNSNTNKFLTGQIGRNGYLSYSLTLPSGNKKRVYAHSLVGKYYLIKTNDKQTQIIHIDGNKLNNCYTNLKWITPKENRQQTIQTELRESNHVFCFNENKQLVAEYINIVEASQASGISEYIILQELNKEVKALSGGFYWSRKNFLTKTKNYKKSTKAKPVNQYDLNFKYITTYSSTGQASKAMGLKNSSHIAECCRGKLKSYKGFIWRYVDDIVSPSGENQKKCGQGIQEQKESVWSGTVDDAFFNSEMFERNRILRQPEYEFSGRSTKLSYYIISADIGRKGCDSVACVFKVTPQPQGLAYKSLVNIEAKGDTHFEDQAIWLKKLYFKYKAKRLIIDGNGMGIGLIDYMVKPQINPSTGEVIVDFGVFNDEEGYYKQFRTPSCEFDALYIIKANAAINTEAHANAQAQLQSGRVKLLIDERVAKTKLMGTKLGQNMTPEKRAEYLKPFTLTSILKEEMMNLKEETEGVNIILKQANKGIKKDKFSAFEYGLYYIKQEEENKKRKKRFNAKEWRLFN